MQKTQFFHAEEFNADVFNQQKNLTKEEEREIARIVIDHETNRDEEGSDSSDFFDNDKLTPSDLKKA